MDYDKLRAGYGFFHKHEAAAVMTMGTSSLAATFAAKDIAPVLMHTERLPKDFNQRMKETGDWVGRILETPTDRDDFVKREYAQAVELGQLHASVAGMVRGPLGWNRKERVPMNGQSYAFVLYTFAWQPVETLLATKGLDPAKEAEGLDAWFHLWSVVGYAMGAPEDLLPRDFARAQAIAPLLRRAQYAAPGESLPAGLPVLLGGHVRMIAARMAAQFKSKPAQTTPLASKMLAGAIASSPGLADALGLGADPAAKLLEYAALPAPQ